MKKIIKNLIIILMVVALNITFCNINKVQAAGISDFITGGDNFINAGKTGNVTVDENKLADTSSYIYNILLFAGMAAAVILGIKFMIGSAEEKAQIKDALIPFVIGCIVIFGAFGIWKIFVTMGKNL